MATFSGTPSRAMGYQSEQDQADELVKRFVFLFASGARKVCWPKIIEQGWFHGDPCNPFNFTDLIQNPLSPEDCSDMDNPKGFGRTGKKLSYYTLKLLIHKLEGSDWRDIRILHQEGNVYVFEFKSKGKPLYVVWWDWFREQGEGKTVELELKDISGKVTITEAVPDAANGSELRDAAYPLFFNTQEVPLH